MNHLHDNAATAAAAAAASSAMRMTGLQLLQAQSMLAPWVDRQDALPAPLSHGPIELLQRAAQLSESPHASAKLVDDTVILLTYGTSYLQDHYTESECSSRRVEEFTDQMESYRGLWRRKALQIQTTWRTQRFHTNRLPVLELKTSQYLQSDVQELIEKKKSKAAMGDKQDSVTDLLSVPVEINEKELQEQVVKYAAELQRRVDARQRDADELLRQQLKEQRAQDDKRKRLALQKKKRYERACRQWHYFATKMLRNARQTQEASDSARRLLNEANSSGGSPGSGTPGQGSDRTQAMMKVLKNPGQRQAIRRFVTKAIARGVSRVLCAYNMGAMADDHDDATTMSPLTGADAETATSTAKVLRLGLLLCDLHFGMKYTGLYQRFFERVAKERGMRVEWLVFNCLKAQFPTKAHQRVVNGFLVAGGPNVGVVEEPEPVTDPEEEDAEMRRRRSSGANGMRKNRHFGGWRERLVVLLRDLYRGKQTILGGMGLGHVILAEAVGGKIGMKEWEDGWSLLDPTIFSDEISGVSQSHDRRLGQSMQGIRFLHGEFVQSMAGVEKSGAGLGSSKQRLKSWRCPGEHSFISCFRDTLTLSLDGSPECGAFVFETLGEFYEREKQQRLRQSGEMTKSTRRIPSKDRLSSDGDEDSDEGDDFKPIVLDTSLSLEEKRKRLGITDASVSVARLFFDHFHRQILNVSSYAKHIQHAKMQIAGVVCSSDEVHLTRSLRQLTHQESVSSIFLNVTASTDGHLVVTNPQAFALLVGQDRRIRELGSKQQRVAPPPSNGSNSPRRNSIERPAGLTLQMLRDHDELHSKTAASLSGSPKHASSRTIRLPSIRADASTKSLSEIIPSGHESSSHRPSMIRRPSAMASQRFGQVSADPGDTVSVLTLSQTLSFLSNAEAKSSSKRIFIRWLDEECKQTHDLTSLNKNDLHTLWLRLIAAIRIADLPNDQVAIVSRHSMVLDYLKRKRPTWTFVKDCRRSEMTHRKRLKKVTQYAAVADIILLDQEFLLSNSANENDALLKRAHALGLHLYVAPRDESPTTVSTTKPLADKPTSTRRVSTLQKRSSRRSVSGLSKEISTKTNQSGSGNAEYDMHVVEFMLLAFSGLDGVITSHPEAAIDALEKIAAQNEAMQQVEQIFRDWQAKDNSKTTFPSKRLVGGAAVDDAPDSDDPADYVAGDNNYDSDDSIPETEILSEMARQWAEHSQSDQIAKSLASMTSGGGAAAAAATGNVVYTHSNTQVPGLVASPFAPLRPLKPRPSDQVFGVASFRRDNSSRGSITPSFTGEGRSQLRSIGSFRAALKPTKTNVSHQQSMYGVNPAPPRGDAVDSGRDDVRSPEAAVLKPMSTRKVLFSPRGSQS